MDSILQFAEDLLVDIPKFWDFLAQVAHRANFCFFADQSFIHSFVFNEYYSCIRSKVVAPTLAPSGPLPLAVVKESAVQVRFLGLIFLSKLDLFLRWLLPNNQQYR